MVTYGRVTDISSWQDSPFIVGHVDFGKMKLQAHSVICRASIGIAKDDDFPRYWKDAKDAGMHRGSYHYYRNEIDPSRQAELYVSMLANDPGELPAFIDLEHSGSGQYGSWHHWYNFLERFKQLMPEKKIGIYTGYYYWLEYTKAVQISKPALEWFEQFPLWIAGYNSTVKVPEPWTDWMLWQYTDHGDGKLYGVESAEIDLDATPDDEDTWLKQWSTGFVSIPDVPTVTKRSASIMYDDGKILEFEEK